MNFSLSRTNDLRDDMLWYLWLNRNIKTCLWVKEKSPDDATLKALFAYSISFLKASVGFCGLFLRKTRSLKGLKEFRNKNCTILLLHIFWTHIFVSKLAVPTKQRVGFFETSFIRVQKGEPQLLERCKNSAWIPDRVPCIIIYIRTSNPSEIWRPKI